MKSCQNLLILSHLSESLDVPAWCTGVTYPAEHSLSELMSVVHPTVQTLHHGSGTVDHRTAVPGDEVLRAVPTVVQFVLFALRESQIGIHREWNGNVSLNRKYI